MVALIKAVPLIPIAPSYPTEEEALRLHTAPFKAFIEMMLKPISSIEQLKREDTVDADKKEVVVYLFANKRDRCKVGRPH